MSTAVQVHLMTQSVKRFISAWQRKYLPAIIATPSYMSDIEDVELAGDFLWFFNCENAGSTKYALSFVPEKAVGSCTLAHS